MLKGLITHTKDTTVSIRKISAHIKQLQKQDISDETSVNLFYCLLELKDHSLYEEINQYLSSNKRPERDLSSSMCTVLTYVLLMSEKVLEEFNPKQYTSSSSNFKRLVPAVRCCKKALFDGCGLDEKYCETVSSALQLTNSHLTELDLSSNDLKDSGVKLIYDGLKSPHCQLGILRLCGCNLTAKSCESLASALQSSSSVLRELDLSNNDLHDSGVKLLSDGLKSLNCQLNILRCSICNLTAQSCESLSSVLQSSNSLLKELDLSNNDLQDSGLKLFSDALKSPNCQLDILRLSGCMVTEEGCHYLSSALTSNPSHLRELDLSYNHPGDSGVKLLSEKLEDSTCSLDKLNVDHGGESRIKEGLKKYECFFTLDPNTAYTCLYLSKKNRKVMHVSQSYPDHPDRFDDVCQVLCRESVCGRCYWETEWTGLVHISVSYKRGDESVFGRNDQSWSLCCSPHRYSFIHNNIETDLSVKPIMNRRIERTGVYEYISRVGVYVDESAGTLSFFCISDTMRLIHTVQTTFTQTLCPGFTVYYKSSVNLC
ncbi:ribonuclease inhibitor-like [Puntigrus tetrazona]|uniref:ribonuclease inhibitor-like n=1 Tax=Puntigrus tetrazona TaxID=1606681 RepID=UPI001C8A5B94|nr:ribonuclease inhibitor-like [Puntigrus tetrazona]